jgi:iron complex transport system substrate-binding protein
MNTAKYLNKLNLNKKIIIKSLIVIIFLYLQANANTGLAQERIISLVPSITQQIYTLEAQNKLVGCTSFCKVNEADKIPVIASAIDVNIEKVVALKPDLIFVSSLVKPQTINTFEELGIKTKNIPTAKNFEELCQHFQTIGDLINKSEKAEQTIKSHKKKVQELKKLVVHDKTQKVFMEIGAKPLFTVLPNTFMDDYIKFVGGTNIASDMKHGTITREAVLVRNPDVIFVVTMGVIGEEEKKTWQSYANINAAKNNKIFVLDSNIASVPTPGNFVNTVEKMINLMY